MTVSSLAQKYLQLEEKEIIFEKDKNGKPFLKGVENFYFNISHSDRYVVCAVSDEPVGVDVEKIRPVKLRLADRFFTEQERRYVYNAENEASQYQRFFEIWTRKEAFVKMDGRGLRIPLDSFDVLTPEEGVSYLCVHQDEEMICHICTKKEQGIVLDKK